MRRIAVAFVSILVTLALSMPAWASSPARRPQANFPAVAPNFACSDTMYQTAVSHGITLGLSPDTPYTYLDPKTKQPTGIDWEINTAVLHWAGIKTIRYQIMPFDSLIPALLSHRIDVIADNIHETPVRNKTISFSSPAWWYGPALIVQKGNPAHIKSYADLTRSAVTVGTITGSAADEYITHLGAHMVSFADNTSEFLSLVQGKVTVVLEDDAKFGAFIKSNPNANAQVLSIAPPSILLTTYGYSYARYGLRKSDCTLNFAYTRALAELRANGPIIAILRKWGLGNRNLFIPGTF
jgi:polar amino acid transport system substrate-binding protein